MAAPAHAPALRLSVQLSDTRCQSCCSRSMPAGSASGGKLKAGRRTGWHPAALHDGRGQRVGGATVTGTHPTPARGRDSVRSHSGSPAAAAGTRGHAPAVAVMAVAGATVSVLVSLGSGNAGYLMYRALWQAPDARTSSCSSARFFSVMTPPHRLTTTEMTANAAEASTAISCTQRGRADEHG